MTLKLNEVIKRFEEVHGSKYIYTSVIFFSTKEKVEIICSKHGSFWQAPNDHFKGRGCPQCAFERIADKLSLSLDDFIEKAIVIHGNKYDYSTTNYIKSGVKVSIICPLHGIFEQLPENHLIGHGCAPCANVLRIKKLSKSLVDFIDDARAIHGLKFDYSKSNYINAYSKIEIMCSTHGVFFQQPAHHLNGAGCPFCSISNRTKTTSLFIEEANKIHSGKYDYQYVVYENTLFKVKINCLIHGVFEQTPDAHLRGNGCPRCVSSISKLEILWLNKLGVPNVYRHQTIKINNKRFYVDAFDPNTNTIYEFYGDFWHGNPVRFNKEDINPFSKKSYGDLHKETLEREKSLINLGYKVISIWESDFKNI